MTAKTILRKWTPTLAALGASVVLTTAVTAALHARVDDVTERPGRGAMPVATVSFDRAESYERDQRFLGVIKAATSSNVGFEVPGAIAEISVYEGQAVEKGGLLARLDTRSLEARRRSAASTVEQIRAQLELARARSERQAPLADSGAISAQAFDDTRLSEKALIAQLAAAEANLETLEVDIDKSYLRAPYAARVGRQHLDQGSVTKAGTPVFTLIANDGREAQIGIAVEQAGALVPGSVYELTLHGETIPATLRGIRPDVDPISLTTAAIFELPEDTLAYDGEPVSMALPRSVEEAGGWVPLSSLLEGDRGIWTVLALRERNSETVALREVVEVLHVSNDQAYVRGTLNDGDRLIGDGVHRVAPGTRVVAASNQQVAER